MLREYKNKSSACWIDDNDDNDVNNDTKIFNLNSDMWLSFL